MTLKRIGIILLISALVAVVANTFHPRRIPWVQDWSQQVEARAAKEQIKVIPLSVARTLYESNKATFIDARPRAEFTQQHIPGAHSIPAEMLEENIPLLQALAESGSQLIVYCGNRDCDDALLLATELQAMGAENLTLYIDGFAVWQKYGGATSSSPADSEDAIPPNQEIVP